MISYKKAVQYLDSFINYEKQGLHLLDGNFDLDKIRKILHKLGDPQYLYKCVHVAGTKGKGSVSTYIASILNCAGYRTGLYTSPHILTVRERISIGGKIITEKEFSFVTEYVKKRVGKDLAVGMFSFFEVYTIIAMCYFAIKKVDHVVFECGLGGRLDATNVISPEVVVMTGISYDHMQVLGNTIRDIAAEKAAIIKKGICCVSAVQPEEALTVIKKKCAKEKAPLLMAGKDIRWRIRKLSSRGSEFDVMSPAAEYSRLVTRMPGDFQVENCALAVGVCQRLLGGLNKKRLKIGIERAFIPGRMEIIKRSPLVVVDGAHNRESAARLVRAVKKVFKFDKVMLLVGISSDKDIKGFCCEIVPLADNVIVTRAATKRAAAQEEILPYVGGKKVIVADSAKEAYCAARKMARKKDLILVAGSFYLVGEVKKIVEGKWK